MNTNHIDSIGYADSYHLVGDGTGDGVLGARAGYLFDGTSSLAQWLNIALIEGLVPSCQSTSSEGCLSPLVPFTCVELPAIASSPEGSSIWVSCVDAWCMGLGMSCSIQPQQIHKQRQFCFFPNLYVFHFLFYCIR